MNIVPRKSFGEMDNFFNDDWFFPVFSKKGFDPEMDVYETENDVVAEVSLPDVDCDDVDVFVEDGVLRVTGEFADESEEGEQGKNYWKREIRKGSFQRAVRVPSEVDEDKVEAVYDKGVLKVTMPKVEPKKKEAKKIKVKKK